MGEVKDFDAEFERRVFKDFDAVWEERQAAPIVVRVFGDEYELPASMPAGLRLHWVRVRDERGDDSPITWNELAAMAKFLFGEETLDRWFDQRLSEAQLFEVIGWVISVYNGPGNGADGGEEGGEGEAEAPATTGA